MVISTRIADGANSSVIARKYPINNEVSHIAETCVYSEISCGVAWDSLLKKLIVYDSKVLQKRCCIAF